MGEEYNGESMLTLLLILFLIPLSFIPTMAHANEYCWQITKNIKFPYTAHATTCVFQDQQGMLWFGTHDGLVRYDGFNLSFYDQNYVQGKHVVMDIVQWSEHQILVADENMFWLLDTKTFQRHDAPKSLSKIPSARTMTMYREVLYVGSNDSGLWYYDMKTGKVGHVKSKDGMTAVYAICPVGNDIFVGGIDGLFQYSIGHHSMRHITIPSKNPFVNSLLWDANDKRLLIGTEGNLYRYNPLTSRMEIDRYLQGLVCKTLHYDANGHLFIGTDAGFYIYDVRNAVVTSLMNNKYKDVLCDNVVWDIMLDRNGDVWLATDTGVTVLERTDRIRYLDTYDLSNTKLSNSYTCLLRDNRNSLWLGGESGLLHVVCTPEGVVSYNYNVNNAHYPLKHNRIRQIYQDRDDDLWIVSDASIARYDKENQQFCYYTILGKNGYSSKWAYNMLEDFKGNLWVVTYSGGVFSIKKTDLLKSKNGVYIDRGQNAVFASWKGSKCMSRVFMDESGGVWLCGANQVVRYDSKERISNILNFRHENDVYCNHALWLSTSEGGGKIYKYTPVDGKLIQLRCQLLEGSITTFVPQKPYLWFSCEEGLFQIDTRNNTIRQMDAPRKPCLVGTYLSESNELLFGGENFMLYYQLPLAACNDSVFVVRESPQEKGQTRTLSFTTFKYHPHQELRFYYQIDDDSRWRKLRIGSNVLDIGNLTPDDNHLIKVACTNPMTDVNVKITSYEIKPMTSWYMSHTAKVMYFLLGIMGAMCLYVIYRKKTSVMDTSQAKEAPKGKTIRMPEHLNTKIDNQLLEHINAIILDNMENEQFNVTILAEKMNMPQKQLYRRVKQVTGCSPIAYIKKMRLQKAASLLKSGNYNMKEIMFMVGYSNASYFIKSFQSEYNVTPKQFAETVEV